MAYTQLVIDGPIATVSLDHPQGNRINFAMRDELLTAFRQVALSNARVLLIRAEGSDFCLGGDIREWPGVPSKELRPRIEVLAEALTELARLAIPTIAAVQGRCLGGGLELALGCDLVIAGRSAQFGCPEALLGIVTLQGGVFELAQRIGRNRALEFVFFGDLHSADEMAGLNLVNRVVPDGQLEDTAGALVDRLAVGPPAAYAATKTLLRLWSVGGPSAAKAALYDISMPLFDAEDVQAALKSAILAAQQGKPFPRASFARTGSTN